MVEIFQKRLMVMVMNAAELTDKFQDWQKSAAEKARNIGQSADEYVRDNP